MQSHHLRCCILIYTVFLFFFFNDTATTEIYTLSLHDALPISMERFRVHFDSWALQSKLEQELPELLPRLDRKSTRLNSSHPSISYAVFCLKKKKQQIPHSQTRTITFIIHALPPVYHHHFVRCV